MYYGLSQLLLHLYMYKYRVENKPELERFIKILLIISDIKGFSKKIYSHINSRTAFGYNIIFHWFHIFFLQSGVPIGFKDWKITRYEDDKVAQIELNFRSNFVVEIYINAEKYAKIGIIINGTMNHFVCNQWWFNLANFWIILSL